MAMRTHQELFGPAGTPRIAIIGAGFAGIGLGVKLRKAGIHTFTIFDAAPQPGGTWWHNQYPGAEVDTISLVYSYAFKPNGWSRTHAPQAELLAYLKETVDEFGLTPHLSLSTEVVSAVWDDDRHLYELTLGNGRVEEFHVVVGATGFLNIPKYPDWPGLEKFRGPKFHTSRWEPEHDLAGKTIAVVGVGSTSTQVVPELAKSAKKLYVFQREPGWILPKDERAHTRQERDRLSRPWHYRWERLKWFAGTEKVLWRAAATRVGSKTHTATQQGANAYIDAMFADDPELRAAVTPSYPIWGKRLIMNSTFYPTLKRENVELVPKAVGSVTANGIVDVDGVERKVDVIVFGTGFQPSNYLGTVEVRGREGTTLNEYWGGEPRGFLGITVPTFPNFYMMYGPGTNGGEIVAMLMRQASYIVGAVRKMKRRGATALEVRNSWTEVWTAWLLAQVNTTAPAQANNYYRTASGKIVTQWPFSVGVYSLLTKMLGRLSERARRREEGDSDLLLEAELVLEGEDDRVMR